MEQQNDMDNRLAIVAMRKDKLVVSYIMLTKALQMVKINVIKFGRSDKTIVTLRSKRKSGYCVNLFPYQVSIGG